MAVGVENTFLASATSATGGHTVSGSMTVTSANALLCLLSTSGANSTTPTVTWDSGGTNQSMTLLNSFNGTAYLYGLLAPTTGTKTVAASWTGNADFAFSLIGLTGVTQVSLGAAFTNFTTGSIGDPPASSTPSITVTTGNGNAGFATVNDDDSTNTETGISGTLLQKVNAVANGINFVQHYSLSTTATSTFSYTPGVAVGYTYAGINVVAGSGDTLFGTARVFHV